MPCIVLQMDSECYTYSSEENIWI